MRLTDHLPRRWPTWPVSGPHDRGAAPRRHSGAWTLPEVLVASMTALLALGVVMLLVFEGAKEQRSSLAESQLHEAAGLLQDRLTQLLREMSASQSSLLGDPIATGSPLCRRLIVARGEPPTYPRQELRYHPDRLLLLHDPNRSVTGDERPLHPTNSLVKLRNALFYHSLKPGGAPDAASLNVWLELDDDGATGRTGTNGTPLRVAVSRSFTVTMRNH